MRSFGKYRVNPMKQSILGIAPGFASVPKVKDFEEAGLTISTDRHEVKMRRLSSTSVRRSKYALTVTRCN